MASHHVYLEVYERCTAPYWSRFSTQDALDAEIKKQIALVQLFPPGRQAWLEENLDAVVERIREAWIYKYRFSFEDANEGDAAVYPTSLTWKADHVASAGIKRGADGNALTTPTQRQACPRTIGPLPIADGNSLKAPAVHFQRPTEPVYIPTDQQPFAADGNLLTAPAVRVPRPTVPASIPTNFHWWLFLALPQLLPDSFRCLQPDQQFTVLPQKSQFSFTGPKPEPQGRTPPKGPKAKRQRQPRTGEGFVGGNAPFQPFFPDGFDPDLSPDFRRIYPTFANIHTEPKRVLVRLLLNDMARETVARCMEALFRGENDLDEAKEWLSKTFETQGRPVIVLSDSDDEDEEWNGVQRKEVRFGEQYEESDHGRAKKKQKVGSSSAHSLLGERPSDNTQVPQQRFKRSDSVTSQMWSKKAASDLQANPPHQPFVTGNRNLQSSALPDIAVTPSRAALEYGSRHGPAIASTLNKSGAMKMPTQRPRLLVRAAVPLPHNSTDQRQHVVIDLTGESDSDDGYEPEEGEILEDEVLKEEVAEDEISKGEASEMKIPEDESEDETAIADSFHADSFEPDAISLSPTGLNKSTGKKA